MYRIRRILIAVSIATALVLLPATAPGQEAAPAEEISAVLGLRAKALNESNREAFLSTVDKTADEFFQEQARYFDNGSSLPLVEHELRFDPDEAVEFTRDKDRAEYGVPVVVAAVNHRYKLNGYDTRPNLRDLSLTFVKRDGKWLVAADDDLEDLGEASDRELWEFGPVRLKESSHFILMYHPDQASYADELLSAAEKSIQLVDRVWKLPWHRKVPIQVPSDEGELGRLLEATYDVGDFVAFAVSAVDRQNEDAWALVGHRIILNRENFLRYPEPVRTSLLAHEVLHVASREASGPFVPAFLDEGFAQLAEEETREPFNSAPPPRGSDGRLPENWEFFSGGQAEILKGYHESESALLFLEERYGLERLNALYEALGKVRIEPGTERYQIDKSFRSALGIGFEDFEREWASAIKAR